MSGGSWDYVHARFHDVAERLARHRCPYRRALARKVQFLSDAMYEIEWADSGDISQEQALEAIQKCLAHMGNQPEWLALHELVVEAKRIRDEIAEQLVRIDQAQDVSRSEVKGRAGASRPR